MIDLDHISGDELAQLRQHGTTAVRNIVLFMDNPFMYADKLEEAMDEINQLVELRESIGLTGDKVQLTQTVGLMGTGENHRAEISQLLIAAGMAKLEEFLRNIGGNQHE